MTSTSIWTQTAKLPEFEQLKRDIKTDVLIIGGGMAGVLCAYMLKQEGVDYTLVEADRIGSGMTENTTAKITAQHGLIYHKLYEKYGLEKARMYLEANMSALAQHKQLCQNIDCDFELKDAFVYSMDDREALEREMECLEKMGFQAEFREKLPLPFSVAGAVRFPEQAQFHPLKFMAQLVQGLNIYEHTRIKELAEYDTLKKCMAMTEHGTITADKIIVATHFPFLNKHGSYFLKMYQSRSYVMAFEQAPQVDGMYVDEAQKGLSFRNYKDLLLIGGGDHRTGKQGGNWKELAEFAGKYYPGAKETYRWAAQDCMTLDGVPYIGHYSGHTPELYVATGFHKWGMTSSMVSAGILADLVLGKENPCADIFSPSRSMLHPQLIANAFEAVMNLLTPTGKRCPHMGCALKWNPQEHSWDCPCHGSRFTEDGKLINNPATGDLKRF